MDAWLTDVSSAHTFNKQMCIALFYITLKKLYNIFFQNAQFNIFSVSHSHRWLHAKYLGETNSYSTTKVQQQLEFECTQKSDREKSAATWLRSRLDEKLPTRDTEVGKHDGRWKLATCLPRETLRRSSV